MTPDELLSIIQPMLVYTGLIEELQPFFKVQKSSSVATVQTQGIAAVACPYGFPDFRLGLNLPLLSG